VGPGGGQAVRGCGSRVPSTHQYPPMGSGSDTPAGEPALAGRGQRRSAVAGVESPLSRLVASQSTPVGRWLAVVPGVELSALSRRAVVRRPDGLNPWRWGGPMGRGFGSQTAGRHPASGRGCGVIVYRKTNFRKRVGIIVCTGNISRKYIIGESMLGRYIGRPPPVPTTCCASGFSLFRGGVLAHIRFGDLDNYLTGGMRPSLISSERISSQRN
jgi:hypothetical protein